MALFVDLVALSNGFGGSIFMDWVALPPWNIQLVKMNALKLSFYLALFTTIEIFVINLLVQDVVFKMDIVSYGLLLVLALSSSFFATVLLQKGVLLLESTRASFICLLEPVTSMIVGILWLNEALTFNKGLGGLAIIISLIIFLKE